MTSDNDAVENVPVPLSGRHDDQVRPEAGLDTLEKSVRSVAYSMCLMSTDKRSPGLNIWQISLRPTRSEHSNHREQNVAKICSEQVITM
jgi:hypothetical protein